MKRFILTVALAVAAALGFSKTADAQYTYGYSTYVPGAGAYLGTQTWATPFGVRTTQGYYSPFTGVYGNQSYYSNIYGWSGYRVGGYNPYTNFGYRGMYNYNPYMNMGNRYGYFYRR
jgi:hypothetical protein